MSALPVLQEWVTTLPFMQQTVLITAIRGADGAHKRHAFKPLMRWYRRCVLLSAMDGRVLTDPREPGGGSFTGPSIPDDRFADGPLGGAQWPERMRSVVDGFMDSRDDLPSHFYTHFMHGAEIIGYKHPDPVIRGFWCEVYVRIVHGFHLHPETEAEMDARLGDDVAGWLARCDASDPAPGVPLAEVTGG